MSTARFRRVVFALDAQTGDPAAAERAAALAARLRGGLVALLVEDIDVVRLVEHGRVSAFSTTSASRIDLAAEYVRDALRLQAARLRRELELAAARRPVAFAVQVRRGRLLSEVLAAAGDDDLVVLAWSGGDHRAPWEAGPPPAAVARALAEAKVRSVLLLQSGLPVAGPLLLAYDGGEASRHALEIAVEIADQDGGRIEAVLLAGRREEADAHAAEISAAAAAARLGLGLVHAPKAGLAVLGETAARRGSTLLVLGADRALSEGDAGGRMLRRLRCSVLLVR